MEGLLDKVEAALAGFGENLYYGMADIGKDEPWDYIVYFREPTPVSSNLTSISHAIGVWVVREGFVADDMADKVKSAMREVSGLRLSREQDIEFDYLHHPSTGRVVEAMLMHFVRPEKDRR